MEKIIKSITDELTRDIDLTDFDYRNSHFANNISRLAKNILNKIDYKDYDFDSTCPEHVFLKVLSGHYSRFPRGFWEDDFDMKVKSIFTFILQNILKFEDEDFKKEFNAYFIVAWKLSAALKKVNDSPYFLTTIIYGTKYNPLEFKSYRHNTYAAKKITDSLLVCIN